VPWFALGQRRRAATKDKELSNGGWGLGTDRKKCETPKRGAGKEIKTTRIVQDPKKHFRVKKGAGNDKREGPSGNRNLEKCAYSSPYPLGAAGEKLGDPRQQLPNVSAEGCWGGGGFAECRENVRRSDKEENSIKSSNRSGAQGATPEMKAISRSTLKSGKKKIIKGRDRSPERGQRAGKSRRGGFDAHYHDWQQDS